MISRAEGDNKRNGETTGIEIYENTISNKIIEEFMLDQRNGCKAYAPFELPSVYRVHEEPSVEKIEQFATLVRNMNYKFKVGSQIKPKSMQTCCLKLKVHPSS